MRQAGEESPVLWTVERNRVIGQNERLVDTMTAKYCILHLS